ncbi:predicted protein [Naegleria gruberi]|uniref:Predicted protein n=1 Tax=Naegleria gruberi TaxID=5762 RepID=D2VPB5_NAEGR|nr:uncharacterized protein NAEGRDRAFT_70796 [Naegleria gruberi]EFC41404.1 predicted protein [Naegleria gruberi]|eukprot:XP_002674148.1 predicted protein [Naegleria gruberi strain NEG-M]
MQQQELRKRKQATQTSSVTNAKPMILEKCVDESCYTVLAILDCGEHVPVSQLCNIVNYGIPYGTTSSPMKFGMVSVVDRMKITSMAKEKQEPVIYFRNSDKTVWALEEHINGTYIFENTLGAKMILQKEKEETRSFISLDWIFSNRAKKSFTLHEQSDCTEQISDHVISSYDSKWNYSQLLVSNIPDDGSYYVIGTQFHNQSPQKDERIILFANFGKPKKHFKTFNLSSCYFLNCNYPTLFLEILDKFDPKLAVNNILIRYIQLRFEEFPEMTLDMACKYNRLEKRGEELFSGGQYSFLETVEDPILLHPLFFLFAFVDMRNDSNPALSKIGNHCEYLMKQDCLNSGETLGFIGKLRKLWDDSIEEAIVFNIENLSFPNIVQNHIRNRMISDQSVRLLLREFSIVSSVLQSEEWFFQTVKLSSLLYNWFKYGI